jgi:hypothetical protein
VTMANTIGWAIHTSALAIYTATNATKAFRAGIFEDTSISFAIFTKALAIAKDATALVTHLKDLFVKQKTSFAAAKLFASFTLTIGGVRERLCENLTMALSTIELAVAFASFNMAYRAGSLAGVMRICVTKAHTNFNSLAVIKTFAIANTAVARLAVAIRFGAKPIGVVRINCGGHVDLRSLYK